MCGQTNKGETWGWVLSLLPSRYKSMNRRLWISASLSNFSGWNGSCSHFLSSHPHLDMGKPRPNLCRSQLYSRDHRNSTCTCRCDSIRPVEAVDGAENNHDWSWGIARKYSPIQIALLVSSEFWLYSSSGPGSWYVRGPHCSSYPAPESRFPSDVVDGWWIRL